MKIVLFFLLVLGQSSAFAQSNLIELSAAIGKSTGTISVFGEHDWSLGKKDKFVVGGGLRFTSLFASDKNFITAPAKLTSGSTGPFVIFKENIEENLDTLFMSSSNVNSINLFINLGYQLSEKLKLGFNIDVIGFSFGKKQSAAYISNNQTTDVTASVTSFNILLVSDNDRGSLNSEFYARYTLSDNWLLKGGAQFIFTEYTTSSEVQQFPEPNDRFRLKSLLFAVGFARRI